MDRRETKLTTDEDTRLLDVEDSIAVVDPRSEVDLIKTHHVIGQK